MKNRHVAPAGSMSAWVASAWIVVVAAGAVSGGALAAEPQPVAVDAGPVAVTVDAGPDPAAARASPDASAPAADAVVPVAEQVEPVPTPGAEAARAPGHPTPAVDPGARVDDHAPAAVDPPALDTAPPLEAPAGEVQAPAAPEAPHLGFGGVPALNFNSDDGFGFGVVGNLYWYDGVAEPYRYNLGLQIFMTTKLVQYHNISLDAVDVFDLPLRMIAKLGYDQSLTANYCGVGNRITCDPAVATQRAHDAKLVDDPRNDNDPFDQFTRHYYLTPYISPYGSLQARWAFTPRPLKLEVFGSWRGSLYIPGSWFDDDKDGKADLAPYPGSLFAQDFPRGQGGFASVLQAGVMLDARDQEAAATRGYWVEASLRGATPFWGSTWTYAGANVTLRVYVPLTPDHKLVLASRLVGDVVVGDSPVQEMVRFGGAEEVSGFGGGDSGRGIRSQRFLGKLRAMNQTELRWNFWSFEAFSQDFDLITAGFYDAALIGYDVTDFKGDLLKMPFGVGGSFRIAWNRDFIIRLDVAVSPEEQFSPGVYINVGSPF